MIAKPTPAHAINLRYAIIAAAAVLGVALLAGFRYPWHTWGAAEVAVLLVCAASIAFVENIQSHFPQKVWVLYAVMVVLETWQALGLAAALLALASGVALANVIRWRRQHTAVAAVLAHGAWRLGAIGLALLLTALVYTLFNGDIPLRYLSLRAALLVPAALLALTTALALLKLMVGEPLRRADFHRLLKPDYFLRFAAILIVIALVPVLLYQNGVIVFVMIQVLIIMQIQRHVRADGASRALEQRVQEFALLNSVSQAVTTTLVLDDVLAAIYQYASKLIDLRGLYVALHNPPQDTLDFRLAIVDGAAVQWHSRRADNSCAAEQVIRTGQPVHFSGGAAHTSPPEPNAAALSYGAYLGLPLIAGSRVLGVMAILSVSDDAFTPEIINTLQTIASQAALAVRNAVLFAQRSELVDGLSHINDSVQNVLFNPNREQALLSACQTALAITRTGRAAVWLLQPDRITLRLESSVGLSAGYQACFALVAFEPDRYAAGPRVITDTRQQPDSAHLLEEGIAACVEMPLLSADGIRGLVAVYDAAPRTYTLTELYLLETLANQITAMLENTQLIQLLELYAFEMTQLVDLSWISTASMNLETVVTNVTHIIHQMTSASRVSLLLLDSDTQRIREVAATPASSGTDYNGQPPLQLSTFPELMTLAAKGATGHRIYHADSDGLSAALDAQMRQHAEHTIALVPLHAADLFLGAVLLGSAERTSFTERQWQLLEMAANQVAAHIRNVQLYAQTRADLDQRLEQLSVAEELAKQVSSSLDFNQIIGNVMDAALRVTQADAAAVALLTDSDQLWVIEQHLEKDGLARADFAMPRDAGVIGHVMRTGAPARVPDNAAFPGYYTDMPGLYGSSLAVPLFSGDDVVGVLNVESVRRDFFTERQATFLASLAAHAVISIDNARFLAEREHQINTLTSLRTLSLRLASADSTPAVAAAVLETGQAMLRACCAVAFRCNETTGALTALAGSGPGCDSSAPLADALARAIVLEAVQTRQLHIVPNIRQHPAYTAGSDYKYASAVAIPIEHHGQVAYGLFFGFLDEYDLQDRDLHTIELLAGQAAGHLENALLHEQIRAGRDQMRAILDSTRAGMILLDTHFYLEAVNPSAERLLGLSLEPHIGSYFPDALPPDLQTGYTPQQIADMALVMHQQPETTTRREFFHHGPQQPVYIEEVGSPVLDDSGRIIGRLLVLQDITEARLLDEHREDLTRMVIHDLRGPLGAIINGIEGGLYTLATPPGAPGYAADIEDTRELLRASHISANRLLRLVNSLLDVSRLEGRQIELDTEPVSLAAVAATAQSALAASAQQAQILITVDVPTDLPPARADSDMLERIIINLLDNAVRYTPNGGQVRISALPEPPGMLRVRVADSGPGIPPQERAHIFEKFGRAQGSEPLRGAHGLGLGLTFCQLAVKAHGGSIGIEDGCEPGGACFSFTLPTA